MSYYCLFLFDTIVYGTMNGDNFFNDDQSFQAICQAAVEGILVVNKKGKIMLTNDASNRMFGYNQGELMGMSINSLVPRKLREHHAGDMASYHKNPKPRRMGVGRDLSAVRKDGSEFPVEISLSNTSINEEVVSIAFCIDISERKKVEEALKKSEEQLIVYASELEEKVKDRTEKLKVTVNELEITNHELQEQIRVREKIEDEIKTALGKERDLNELKSRFVSMASHEFRTPLSTILSSASLIGKYTDDEAVEKRSKHVNRIKSSVANLTNILDDFLSLGKLEEGRVDLSLGDSDIVGLINEVIDELNVIMKRGQEIMLKVTGDPYLIQSDRRLLKNVIINVTSNAIKYSPEQSIIELSLIYKDDKVRIEIVDKGIGIPEKDQKHLFTRFFRAGNAINLEGTGLGLNIVKKYLELLNGSISFKSKLNEGSSFSIELPFKHSKS